jgi:hypothetical protein
MKKNIKKIVKYTIIVLIFWRVWIFLHQGEEVNAIHLPDIPFDSISTTIPNNVDTVSKH